MLPGFGMIHNAWRRWRIPTGIVSLYFLLALSLMGPIASDDLIAWGPDHVAHPSIIVQARQALEEGQFPLRVAPWQHGGKRYPAFQFYSSLPYLAGGMIYKYVTPDNPYAAYKMVMLLFVTMGGVFAYRCARYLTGNRAAALLAGAVYVLAPYLIVNMLIRAAFTEVAAQGVLPAAIYYGLRCAAGRRWQQVVWAGLWLGLLAATHIITFLFGSLFLGLMLAMLTVRKTLRFRRLLRVGAAYAIVCVLMMYFLAPMLLLKKEMYISSKIGESTPAAFNWLTPLSGLLAPFDAAAEPQPGRTTSPDLNPAIGWPVGIAMAAMVVLLVFQREKIRSCRGRFLVVPLLSAFLLALFAAWSPFDFWQYLPSSLHVAQFSYRLLTHVMWSGALLLAFTLCATFSGKVDIRHVMVGMVIIGTASGSYIHTLKISKTTVEDIKQRPEIGGGGDDYLVDWSKLPPLPFDRIKQLPIPGQGDWVQAGVEIPILCPRQSSAVLRLRGVLPPDVFKAPVTLFTLVDGVQVGANRLNPGPFELAVTVPIPAQDFASGKPFRLSFGGDSPLILRDMAGNVVRKYICRFLSMAFDGTDMVPFSDLERDRSQKGDVTLCKVKLDRAATVQLPVLYYPRVLEFAVDGKTAEYFPTIAGNLVLIGAELPAGEHELAIRFAGLAWANYLSLGGWLIIFWIVLGNVVTRWVKRRRAGYSVVTSPSVRVGRGARE